MTLMKLAWHYTATKLREEEVGEDGWVNKVCDWQNNDVVSKGLFDQNAYMGHFGKQLQTTYFFI